MDMSKQPGINILAIILLKESFYRVKAMPKAVDVNIEFNSVHEKVADSDNTQLIIKTKLVGKSSEIIKETNDNIAYVLEFDYVGVFTILPGEENMPMDEFIINNAAAIMIPYIREHISSITQKASIGTIYLKPINVVALLNKNKLDNKSENKIE
jgi:preprotein translocase subunit SecB